MVVRSVVPILLASGLLSGCGPAMAPATTGPASPSGALFIVGGGPRPADLMEVFLDLAGGPTQARVLVLPMSSGSAEEAGEYLVDQFREAGASAEFRIFGQQPTVPDVDTLFARFNAIWISGGDQNRFMRAVENTPVETAIRDFYQQGGVVGGTSAGAAVMSSVMITGEELRPGGDRPTDVPWATIMADNVVTSPGLGLLPNAVIDQHFLRRRRSNRLISVVLEHPHLVGVGIDESTAIVVHPNGQWSVAGRGQVMVVDATSARVSLDRGTAADVRVHLLSDGDRYDPVAATATVVP